MRAPSSSSPTNSPSASPSVSLSGRGGSPTKLFPSVAPSSTSSSTPSGTASSPPSAAPSGAPSESTSPTISPSDSPSASPTAAPIPGMEDCTADGTCNENCSDLSPDPDCDDPGAVPKCSDVSSDFELGDEGWTIVGDSTSADPSYNATGGNPGGHIFAIDDVLGGTWYFQAPIKYRGDFSGAYGKFLQFDLKQSRTSSQFNDPDVIISSSSDGHIWFNTETNPGTNWTSYSVEISESAGWNLETNAPATETDIRAVLSDIDDIQIRGEYRSGSDTGGLDNVVLESSC